MSLIACALLITPIAFQDPDEVTFKFNMAPDVLGPKGELWGKVQLYHHRIKLSPDKPTGLKKEPTYLGTPQYGVFNVGNGPSAEHVVVLDETTSEFRIYVDANRNGDLTDDGDGKWSTTTARGEHVRLGPHPVSLRASWGNARTEISSAEYGYIFYRSGKPGEMGTELTMRRQSARSGEVTFAGKKHKALLIENDSDAVFAKPVDAEGKPRNGRPSQGVHLAVDLNDDGEYEASEFFDVRGAVNIAGTTWQPRVSIDGSTVIMYKTVAAARITPVNTPRAMPTSKPLLEAGTVAPDFTAQTPDGKEIKLSSLRGKVVVLDFWATWCGPCVKSMPHLQKVYEKIKTRGGTVLSVCVWDDKQAYLDWLPKNKDKYNFPTAFDPAAKNSPESIAKKLYNVTGIPTMYVIDKDGKVITAILGFNENDTRLEQALAKAGIS